MLYLYRLNIYDEAIMYSSTLGLFAFKNCDTHSLQHTKQKKSLKMRESSPGECKVHYFKECLLYIALSTMHTTKSAFYYTD